MVLKPIGIEDDNTFGGRVDTALSQKISAVVTPDLDKKLETITTGTTTTGDPGSEASVSVSGTGTSRTFSFTIPRGDTGIIISDSPPANPSPGQVYLSTVPDYDLEKIPGILNRWDLGMVTHLANGTALELVSSKAGIGTPMHQPTLANRPTLATNAINGRNAMRLTSANFQFTQASVPNIRGPFTIGMVFKAPVNPAQNNYLISSGEGVYFGALVNANGFLGITTSGGADKLITYPTNTWWVVVFVVDGPSSRVYANNRISESMTITNQANVGFPNQIRFGRNSSTQYSDATIAETVVYNRGLNDAECADILSELSRKYAVTLG